MGLQASPYRVDQVTCRSGLAASTPWRLVGFDAIGTPWSFRVRAALRSAPAIRLGLALVALVVNRPLGRRGCLVCFPSQPAVAPWCSAQRVRRRGACECSTSLAGATSSQARRSLAGWPDPWPPRALAPGANVAPLAGILSGRPRRVPPPVPPPWRSSPAWRSPRPARPGFAWTRVSA